MSADTSVYTFHGNAWLDHDGQHVWIGHSGNGTDTATMLPWPKWSAVNGRVQPSIHCLACGYHPAIDPAPPREDGCCST